MGLSEHAIILRDIVVDFGKRIISCGFESFPDSPFLDVSGQIFSGSGYSVSKVSAVMDLMTCGTMGLSL